MRQHHPDATAVPYQPGRFAILVKAVLASDNPWHRAALLADHDPLKWALPIARQYQPETFPQRLLIAPNSIVAQDAQAELIEAGFAVEWLQPPPGRLTSQVPEIDVHTLYAQRDRYVVIDVREPFEWRSGQISGAISCPMPNLADVLDALADDASKEGQAVAFVCATGRRSGIASWAAMRTLPKLSVVNVSGGMFSWFLANYPTSVTIHSHEA